MFASLRVKRRAARRQELEDVLTAAGDFLLGGMDDVQERVDAAVASTDTFALQAAVVDLAHLAISELATARQATPQDVVRSLVAQAQQTHGRTQPH